MIALSKINLLAVLFWTPNHRRSDAAFGCCRIDRFSTNDDGQARTSLWHDRAGAACHCHRTLGTASRGSTSQRLQAVGVQPDGLVAFAQPYLDSTQPQYKSLEDGRVVKSSLFGRCTTRRGSQS
jgi:hypothetical protein